MQRVPDPYGVLGLVPEATMAEVKAAHRRLAKRYHPDAPHADAARFLAVQDAYELLRDPLRRREWDRQHVPGPVRAEPATAGRRRRGSASSDPQAASKAPASPRGRDRSPVSPDPTFGPNDRPPQADSWTWTAEGVPWWEDGGGPRARRSARRRASGRADEAPPADTADAAEPTAASGAPRPTQQPDRASRRRRPATPADSDPMEGRSEFDVFSRSSGAAWSSASRAYFRRRAADMPSGAASPNTPRWTTPVGAPPPRRYAVPPIPPEPEPEPEPEPRAAPRGGPRAGPGGPEATTVATPPPPAAAGAPVAARHTAPTPPRGGSASSRRLGAALAALFRRSDR